MPPRLCYESTDGRDINGSHSIAVCALLWGGMSDAHGDSPEPQHRVRDKSIEDLVAWAAVLPSSNWNQLQQLVSTLSPGNMAGHAGAGCLPKQIEQATIFLVKNNPKMGFPRLFSNPKGPQAEKIQGSWARCPRATARHGPAGKAESFFAPRGPTPTCRRRTPQPCLRPGWLSGNLPFIAFSSRSSQCSLEAVQQAQC